MKSNSRFSRIYNSRLFWMIISLLASLFIWVYVTGTQEETISRGFSNVEVQLVGEDALLESRGYVLTELDTAQVYVRISGTRSNIGFLSEEDVKAVVDVSKLTSTGKFTVAYALAYPDGVDASAVSVLNSNPSTVSFYVSKVSSKSFAVRGAFVGTTEEGYIAGEPEFEPKTVTISGPESVLGQIDHVWATIGGENVNKSKTAEVPFVLRDAEGRELELEGLDFDTDTISVTLPISAKKEVPLSVTFIEGSGAVEGTYTYTIDPVSITISGDTSIVGGINKIDLGVIDLTDFEATREFTFPIVLNNEIENVTGVTEAKVVVEIVGLETKKFSVTNLSFTDLPEGYTGEILNKSIEVTIRAEADVLKNIRPNNISAVATLADISSTGDFSVPVRVLVDGFTNAGAVGDYKITVNIKR